MQAEMVRIRDEQRSMQASLTAVHQTLAAHSTLLNQLVEDSVSIRTRLDRIERRLDLVDAAQ
jgi:hypothetical protein